MAKFRDLKILQGFTSVHTSNHNHLDQGRLFCRRDIFRLSRADALDARRELLGRAHLP
jgi:hypothetical protein